MMTFRADPADIAGQNLALAGYDKPNGHVPCWLPLDSELAFLPSGIAAVAPSNPRTARL